ncbi:MAG TPA: adenylate/guanylate cyclase domain-containing protein, partial [Dehalococcoidia bacterium]|nr:adenylate/guanylate cyclase domain-containing protein [Dehalococcoidia bacterium]
CNGVLTIASVIGREFGLDALERVSDVSGDRLLELLEEAVAARVVAEVPRAAGRYSFSHALIRETLYEELGTTRRVRLHRQIGEVLEGLYGANPEPHLAELAYHFFEGAQGGDVDKAIDYASRAGERATALLAYEEASGHYETALQALEAKDKPDGAQRCELLLALGEALNNAGSRDQAQEIFEAAAHISRRLGRPDKQARAALGYAGPWGEYGTAETVAITLLEEALAGLGSEDSALRARVLARLSWALAWALERERSEELSRQALEMAQRVGDARALGDALWRRQAAYHRPAEVQKRLEMADDLLQLARDSGDGWMTANAHWVRQGLLLQLGDVQAFDVEIEEHERAAQELRLPSLIGISALVRALRALLVGRFEEAERLGREAFALGQRAQDPLLAQNCLIQLMALRWSQGRLDEMEALVSAGAQQSPNIPAFRAGLAMTYAELGREEQAKVEFEGLAVDDFANLPDDASLPLTLAYLSVAADFLDDARRAAVLYDLLLPYAGHNIILGAGAACLGSASRSLGLLATTMERWGEAKQHFEDALEMHARMGARPWVAYTQHQYANMLLARDAPGDREKALELVTEALDAAQEMGMKALVEKALALKLRAQGVDLTSPRTSIDAVAASVYVDKPDLRAHAAPDGTVTIMFSDIEGSTAITERLGDQRWLELLRAHNAIVRRQVKAHGGFEVKSQ